MQAAVDHVFRSFRQEPSKQDVMSRASHDDATPNDAVRLAAQLLENYRDHLAERSPKTAHAPSR
jgi:hypothetical protein